ncbi:universal stress protein UspA [Brevirhabdus pacifica]|uniref:Universal stress protein UspA n=1 Tax=Brevirhabdus pacifica TaxID=1267768 RepID=A0A1U7DJY9_9RHOB|nr:universal stress protein [Brevirhabdus pacifica]APX90314.1 universal stress protein UspA [Brevirhabdus pacifica]OWU78643.1 universal stress protein UspA [Loktanella sp. 22II-4b]PJJ80765.1 universal stress protein family protein [Brevirhabdus pacifica]
MIRKILVPVRGDGKGDNVLAHAAALAHRFKAHIEVTHCRPRPEDLIPYGVPIPDALRRQLVQNTYALADQEEQGLKDEVHALAQKLGLDDTGQNIGERATVSFVEEVGRQLDVIKRHGRLADVICVAKPDRDRNLGTNTLKAALFHSGRPVLMCPPVETPPTELGKVVTIAWNGSSEAARALSEGMRIICSADRIGILSTGKDAGPGTSAEDLVAYLRLHGVTPELVTFEASRSIGQDLLSQSAIFGADVMIMGAYGDSHERETLFGGNTQTVIDRGNMPVWMSH